MELYDKHFRCMEVNPGRRTILFLYVPGFQRQVFTHVKILSERSKEIKEQKKNKGSVLVVEFPYNCQNALFGLVMLFTRQPFFQFHDIFQNFS